MAHEIEGNSMAYASKGGVPWHGLGVPVSNDLTPAELCQAAGIDWEVKKLSVHNSWNGQDMIVPDRYNLTRMSDGRVLDIVGSLYKPTQNLDAAKFFHDFVVAGSMSMETAGSLNGGRRIWVLAKIGEGFTLAGGDRVEGYLLLSLPHIQGMAITCKLTRIRVVCANTEQAALRGFGADWRMTHARAFDAGMQEQAKVALGLAKEKMVESAKVAEVLSTSRVQSYDRLIEYVATVSGSKLLDAVADETETPSGDASMLLDSAVSNTQNLQLVRGFRETDLNRVGAQILESIMSSPGSDLESAKGTYWGALQGVTHFVDHVAGQGADTRLNSAWFGQRATLKQQAATLAVQMATGKVN